MCFCSKRTYKILHKTWFLYYVAFLDASKAFDRVNHTKLFSKLLRPLGLVLPKWIIKVLVQWYCNQSMYVRWGSVFSLTSFLLEWCKTGGIISPLLFNVYIGPKRAEGVTVKATCWLLFSVYGNTVVNHLIYADVLTYLLHQQRDCKRLSMCVMHMVVIII